MSKKKKSEFEIALDIIEKKWGKNSVIKANNKDYKKDVDVIPTGSISLNRALGVGGFPKGRTIEIFGSESSGKTTLAYSTISEAQKQGDKCIFVDAEHAFDPKYAEKMGVDLDKLHLSKPDCGEEALDTVEIFAESKEVDLIVVDSVSALVPKAEAEGDMEDNSIGLQARLMSQALRKITSKVSKSNTCVIFINQIRMKVGVMFGSPETTSGGRALRFYSSVRVKLTRSGTIKQGEDFVGAETRAIVIKNKVAPPFRKTHFEIYFDEGLSKTSELIDEAVLNDIIVKKGSWYSYNDDNIAQGKNNVRIELKNNPELFEEIKEKILKLYDENK